MKNLEKKDACKEAACLPLIEDYGNPDYAYTCVLESSDGMAVARLDFESFDEFVGQVRNALENDIRCTVFRSILVDAKEDA